MSLRVKLYSSYFIILSVWLASGVYFILKVHELGSILESIAPLEIRKIKAVKSLVSGIKRQEELALLISRPVTYREAFTKNLPEVWTETQAGIDSVRMMSLEGRDIMESAGISAAEKFIINLSSETGLIESYATAEPTDDAELQSWARAARGHDSLRQAQNALIVHARYRQWNHAQKAYRDRIEPGTSMMITDLQSVETLIIQNTQMRIQFLRQFTTLIKILSYGVWSLTLISLIALIFFDFHRIVKGLHLIQKATARIAKGEFEARITQRSFSEMNELALSFNTMAEQLQELERVKSDFFNKLVHDFKSPLDNIKQSADVILSGMTGANLTEKQREFLEIIKRSATGMRQFVQDQLDEARLIAGQTELKYEMTDLKTLVTDRIQLQKPVATMRKIQFTVKSTPTAFQISCDKSKICRVTDNLLNNAIKYSGEHTTIEVEMEEYPDLIEVRIRDHGPGIPETQQERIFQKYVRLTAAAGLPGTGLGLYTARYIIQLHGGVIWVKSRPNEGAVFGFSLPKKSGR